MILYKINCPSMNKKGVTRVSCRIMCTKSIFQLWFGVGLFPTFTVKAPAIRPTKVRNRSKCFINSFIVLLEFGVIIALLVSTGSGFFKLFLRENLAMAIPGIKVM